MQDKNDLGLTEKLTELRDLARTGLPTGGMTTIQWAHHRLARIARDLDSLIADRLERAAIIELHEKYYEDCKKQ